MLNERIRQLREARGMTQVELARQLSVTKQSVSNWENNNIQPSVEMAVAIADFFGVTLDDLLGRAERRHCEFFRHDRFSSVVIGVRRRGVIGTGQLYIRVIALFRH